MIKIIRFYMLDRIDLLRSIDFLAYREMIVTLVIFVRHFTYRPPSFFLVWKSIDLENKGILFSFLPLLCLRVAYFDKKWILIRWNFSVANYERKFTLEINETVYKKLFLDMIQFGLVQFTAILVFIVLSFHVILFPSRIPLETF